MEPGFVNAHTHLYSGLAPLGMPAPDPAPEDFLQVLQRVWWRLDRALDAASLAASARYAAAEALLAGTTTVIDHHESPSFIEGSLDVLADACQGLGLRAMLCYGATERNGGHDEAARGLAECRRFCRENDRPLVRALVGLHASFTVSDETIREAGELARELGTVLHVHVAEDVADLEDAARRGYSGPVQRLLELGALVPGSILAHGVHLTDAQVRLVGRRGAWIVQNPRSNRGNRVGYPRALWASGRVALGTDGYPSDMRAEQFALLSEAMRHGDEAASTSRRLAGGWALAAERYGMPFSPPGPGAAADLVALESSGDGGPVRARGVVVGGRSVVEGGRLLTGDLEEIRAEARSQADRLWGRMAAL